MAEFMVQAQDLKAKAEELRGLKQQLQAKCTEYAEKGSALAGSFEGDTASMFLNEVNMHNGKMSEFINLVEQYCVAMEQNAARYANADNQSADIVKTKNF